MFIRYERGMERGPRRRALICLTTTDSQSPADSGLSSQHTASRRPGHQATESLASGVRTGRGQLPVLFQSSLRTRKHVQLQKLLAFEHSGVRMSIGVARSTGTFPVQYRFKDTGRGSRGTHKTPVPVRLCLPCVRVRPPAPPGVFLPVLYRYSTCDFATQFHARAAVAGSLGHAPHEEHADAANYRTLCTEPHMLQSAEFGVWAHAHRTVRPSGTAQWLPNRLDPKSLPYSVWKLQRLRPSPVPKIVHADGPQQAGQGCAE